VPFCRPEALLLRQRLGEAAVALPAHLLLLFDLPCIHIYNATAGLKRYFYGKRMEGLLSARGLRILDAACEVGLEDPSKPVRLWGSMSRSVLFFPPHETTLSCCAVH
jgi:hypothetical protein